MTLQTGPKPEERLFKLKTLEKNSPQRAAVDDNNKNSMLLFPSPAKDLPQPRGTDDVLRGSMPSSEHVMMSSKREHLAFCVSPTGTQLTT